MWLSYPQSNNKRSDVSIAKVKVEFLLESGKSQTTAPTPVGEEGITEAGNLSLLEEFKALFM